MAVFIPAKVNVLHSSWILDKLALNGKLWKIKETVHSIFWI